MRVLLFFFLCFSCYSQQQVLSLILDDESTPPSGFAGNFQLLFENNTNEETGNHTPTVTGTPNYTPSVNAYNGQAISLDGSVYIDLPSSADFTTTSFTIAFWIRRASFPSGFDAIFEHDRFGTNWYGVFASGTAGQLNVRSKGLGGTDDLTTSVSWTTGTWYHIIFTYDGTTGTVFRDGVSILSSTMGVGTLNASGIRLFRNQDDGEGFVGNIDRIEFWNVAKNATEAADIEDCARTGNNCNN